MASMIDGIVSNTRTEGFSDATGLTATQRKLMEQSGLEPGTKEWQDQELKMKVGNLANAVSLANELAEALKSMRKTAVDGMGR